MANKPRKIRASIRFLAVDDNAPSAERIQELLTSALNLRGLSYELEVEELKCNCGSDAWPSYCAYHNKTYGG